MRLKNRNPNLLLGLCGIGLLIVPTTIHILVVSNLSSLAYAIHYFGGDAELIHNSLRNIFFSFSCGWILFATKAVGIAVVFLAIARAVHEKRPAEGYLPIVASSRSSPKEQLETKSVDGA